MWLSETDSHNLIINILSSVLSSIFILIVAFNWKLVKSFFSFERAAFRRIFGKRAIEAGRITVTLDTYRDLRLLPPHIQQGNRFYKVFPDGHITQIPGAYGDLLGYCTARGAGYLINHLARLRDISIRVVSDGHAASEWEGTFINLGSSYSNMKTDHIKKLPENPWLFDDLGKFIFKDGKEIVIDQNGDKAIILKVANPYFPGYALIVCAGLGEWGGSGSAWFLSTHWRRLSRRFGRHPFLVVVNVASGSDESAREILSYGNETALWRYFFSKFQARKLP